MSWILSLSLALSPFYPVFSKIYDNNTNQVTLLEFLLNQVLYDPFPFAQVVQCKTESSVMNHFV